ncbi:EAL domain-containing protein [Vibrio chagasii]|uniref:EAL domain-containing protein n=1 Tax=Vibrio chagasii TaxID=170679 RepID=UPI003DA08004
MLKIKNLSRGKFLLLESDSNKVYATFHNKYQDIVSFNGDTVATEVLSRVKFADGKEVSSEVFFRLVDDSIVKDLIIHQITFSYEGERTSFNKSLFTFNVNASCLEDTEFIEKLTKLDVSVFALEVNGSLASSLSELAVGNINKLRARGHEVWLDDYFSLSDSCNVRILDSIKWDVVKIDKSLFLLDECYPGELVRLVNRLLLDYEAVVVEGVEHLSQAALFKGNDRVFLQGYLYSACLYYDDWLHLNSRKLNNQ